MRKTAKFSFIRVGHCYHVVRQLYSPLWKRVAGVLVRDPIHQLEMIVQSNLNDLTT
jgi:hypothetical protein